MATRKALITGVTGQDGSYLAELLLQKGYEVHALVRRSASPNLERISHIVDMLEIHHGDLCDFSCIAQLVESVHPDEIYNLAAQSFVPESWNTPEYTTQVTGLGALRCLEAIRRIRPIGCRFYQASSSEMFGKVHEVPQNEDTRFYPRSPYGVAKAYAHYITRNYRESFGLHASSGILFNHESPRRGFEFVTRKITRKVAEIYHGSREPLVLGNLNARRDWGHARDYVRAMWLMLQQQEPGDYVISSGSSHSVRDFVRTAFETVGIDIHWEGEGLGEIGVSQQGEVLVQVSEDFFRPAEVDILLGDNSHAKRMLGWEPTVTFRGLVNDMVARDVVLAKGA